MDALETFVSTHDHLTFVENDRIKCTLTNHEMKPNLSEVKVRRPADAQRYLLLSSTYRTIVCFSSLMFSFISLIRSFHLFNTCKAHLKSKSYRKATWYAADYSDYLPWITPHRRNPLKLYCTLTRKELNKIPNEVSKHVRGKKFIRLKKAAQEKRKNDEKKRASSSEDAVSVKRRRTDEESSSSDRVDGSSSDDDASSNQN